MSDIKRSKLQKLCKFCSGIPLTIVSGLFLVFSLYLMLTKTEYLVDPAIVTIAISGFPLVSHAIEKLFCHRVISSALLVSIAMAACIALGEYFAAGEVAFIMMLGEMLEKMTVNRARRGLKKLLTLVPTECCRLHDGQEEKVSAAQIQQNDLLRIFPGETIPVDGVIVSGESSVNQAAITGESLPVDKSMGDAVFSGGINCFGSFDMRATKVGEDSSLQKLIRMVQEAENKKAPTQRIVDRWASWLVPAALGIAVITYLVTFDIIRAVTVLVVFCPCSLVLATPTAIMAAIGQATKHGVLIKSGEALENMGKANIIAFDKTGTLTHGKLTVSDIIPFTDSGLDQNGLLQRVAGAESRSEHPLGKAVIAFAKEKGIVPLEMEHFSMSSGKGVRGIINGKNVLCGNETYLEENGIVFSVEAKQTLQRIRTTGKAVVIVSEDETLKGVVTLSDSLRPEVQQVMTNLKELKIQPVLLTGDHLHTAKHFASQAGIETVHAGLLPQQKATTVSEFQKEGKYVCMIGDGINDAPALKVAQIGVAMAQTGSDIAIEAADIALIGNDLEKIPYMKRLSNAVQRSIKMNITLSMGINCLAILLSVIGILGPISGALVHNAGSVLVILNAALLYDKNFR
ncbi:MAG: cation-translocating P-type ATPase [Planctomycetia bacterium]|nr:cation-translocating P-type ATPase [Planctomycetia bacterium]